jgi:hypothetical protein
MSFYLVQLHYNKTQHTKQRKQNIAHRTPQTIKDTLHAVDTMHIQFKNATIIKNLSILL